MGAPKLDYSLIEQKAPLTVVYSDLDKKFDNSPDEKIELSRYLQPKTVRQTLFDRLVLNLFQPKNKFFYIIENTPVNAVKSHSLSLSHLDKVEEDDILALAQQHSDELTERLSSKGKQNARWDKINEEITKAREVSRGNALAGMCATFAAIVFTPFTKFKSDKYYKKQKAAQFIQDVAVEAQKAVGVHSLKRLSDYDGFPKIDPAERDSIAPFTLDGEDVDLIAGYGSDQFDLMIECANEICKGKSVPQPKIKGPDFT